MQKNAASRWIGGLCLAGGIGWMLSRQLHFSGWVDDDAFISFRYARNWAEGHGLVFNPGERVEGFTNFLWTALLALAQVFHLDLPATAQVLGVLVAVGTVLLLAARPGIGLPANAETDRRFIGPSLALLPALALCLTESWAAWSVGGLENVLSGLLVVGAFVTYQQSLEQQERARPLRSCAILLCLAILNHPTNAVFAAVLGSHLLWSARRQKLRSIVWLPFFAILAIVLGMFLLGRLVYYGDLLPNTWYAKGGMSLAVWRRGMRYFAHILAAYPVGYGMTLVILVGALRRRVTNTALRLLAVSVLLCTLYIIAVGGEEFPAYRSTVVLVPLFCLMLPPTLYWIWGRMNQPGTSSLAVALVLLLAFTVPLAVDERVRRLDTAVDEARTDLSRTAALLLKKRLPADILFAHSGAGLIAYYTNFRWIDTLGLCDHHIARTRVDNLGEGAAGHEKGDGRYVWERQPDYVMFPGYPISNRLPGTKSDKELWSIPEFHKRYRPLHVGFTFQAHENAPPRQVSLFLYQRIDPGER